MKKLLVSALILCASFVASANNKVVPTKKLKVTSNVEVKKATLTYLPTSNEKVLVKIINERGEVVYKETINETKTFVRPYDFSQLSSDKFIILVKEGKEVYKEVIDLNDELTSNFDLVASTKEINENTFEVKVLQSQKQDVNIVIRDQNGRVLYSSNIEDRASFIQQFELTQKYGEVTLEVSNKRNSKTIVL